MMPFWAVFAVGRETRKRGETSQFLDGNAVVVWYRRESSGRTRREGKEGQEIMRRLLDNDEEEEKRKRGRGGGLLREDSGPNGTGFFSWV
jgi:hypothetical protein